MANTVRSGFMGLANIGNTQIRCTSFSVNPNQDVSFYNHVIGLKDTIPTDSTTKGEILPKPVAGNTYANIQRKIWRPSPISITGGMAFPATETSLKTVFDLARYANYFDLAFIYYCASGLSQDFNARTFNDCRINGFDFSITSGDIVNISIDVVGKNVEQRDDYVHYTTPQKLITWDEVNTTITNAPFTVDKLMINGLSFKINNNIQTIYTAGTSLTTSESLYPYDLRVGMQEVTGSLSVYLDAGKEFIPINLATPATIQMIMPSLTVRMTVVFKSNQMDGLVGPIITQLPFVGVDYSFEPH